MYVCMYIYIHTFTLDMIIHINVFSEIELYYISVTGPQSKSQLRTLIDVAALNSRVVMEMKPAPLTLAAKDGKKSEAALEVLTPNGDATELGLYRFFGACVKACTGMEIEEYRAANPKVHEVPFNSSNKWQMSIHSMQYMDGKQLLFIKGAPDVLLDKCSHYLADDGSLHLCDDEFSRVYTENYEEFGGNGER
jgi:magnesium-transporting ATPase (P-type)